MHWQRNCWKIGKKSHYCYCRRINVGARVAAVAADGPDVDDVSDGDDVVAAVVVVDDDVYCVVAVGDDDGFGGGCYL